MFRLFCVIASSLLITAFLPAQPPATKPTAPKEALLLIPARVFDGVEMHEGWVVRVRGERIEYVGPPKETATKEEVKSIPLPGTTLLPGLIDAHTHVLLHAYNETSWEDQVLKERKPCESAGRPIT